MNNPYTPPGSPVRDPPESKPRSTLGAVLLGLVVDVGATMLLSVVVTSAFAMFFGPSDAKAEDIAAALQGSSGFQLISMVGGLSCTVLGAYVAARFANRAEYATAFAVGVASLVFSEATLIALASDVPLWERLIGDLLVIPAAIVGGHLRFLQKHPAPQKA